MNSFYSALPSGSRALCKDGKSWGYDYNDAVVEDLTQHCHSSKSMSVSKWHQGKSRDTAVKVSYAFLGRPRVDELNHGSPVLLQVQLAGATQLKCL
jgi:hypothetical protein